MRRIAPIAVIAFSSILAAACSSDSGSSDNAASGAASDIVPTDAAAVVDSDLLGDGNYTGSGRYTIIEAQKAYSASLDATAVAAKISVPGEESLCLFWHIGGQEPGDGLIIGDTVTRQFSVWSAIAAAGSPADQTAVALKESPEGKAVIAASGC